ncbi:MAG: hypothetical protein Athens101410_692 [Parcubacteria group bacterium Athens1014_10]|nr:MAG: hypothetical protein Athens101410_692 [Parcubacteria group bacterium Athens1014_10]TSD04605.1 MAG: hypothetical protein Athens071412_742 [Parcubacteria group bacterium Athens0714_12]
MRIKVSPQFQKNYKKLPNSIKEKAKKKETIFRNNPFDSQLKTHKLSGRHKDSWAFWVDYSYRIIFIFLSSEEILFLDIGSHKVYK